jgi:hypothetical protein
VTCSDVGSITTRAKRILVSAAPGGALERLALDLGFLREWNPWLELRLLHGSICGGGIMCPRALAMKQMPLI